MARTRFAHDYADYYERYLKAQDEQKHYLTIGRTTPSWYSNMPDVFELQDIERWIDWRNINRNCVTIRIENDRCSIFSNDQRKLEELSEVLLLKSPRYTRAVNTVEDSVITLQDPQHKYRTYLTERKLELEEIAALNDFVDRYTASGSVMASQGLARWLNQSPSLRVWWRGSRTRCDYYFEHDDPGMPLIFALIFPDLLRKTFRLEPR
jgi:hypothetical protein